MKAECDKYSYNTAEFVRKERVKFLIMPRIKYIDIALLTRGLYCLHCAMNYQFQQQTLFITLTFLLFLQEFDVFIINL